MNPPERNAALECRSVVKRYPGGVVAVDGIDLRVERGELVALIGESGSGKTTLLRMFNRLVEPDDGDVRIDGEPIRERDPFDLRRSVGYVQQEGGLLPHWTVEQNVGLVPELLGWPESQRSPRIDEVLSLVRMPANDYGQRYPRELSGGQRQRVAVARALAANPEIILLDEPFGALDPITRTDLQREFAELKDRLGQTIVLVTHDLSEAFRLADRLGVLRSGKLEQIGTEEQLHATPASNYVRRLIERFEPSGPRR